MDPYSMLLAPMREFFQSGETLSYQFRKAQLTRLREGIFQFENELHAALFSDLKKSPEESWVTETGFVVAEINHALKNLKHWMRPKKVGTNLLNFPSRSLIYKEPMGVVFIVGPWNYPLQLLLNPLVGALAAGNCAVLKPSELAPATSAVIKTMVETLFPAHYVSCVTGLGNEVVPSLMAHFRFDHIFYTGSTRVGKKIYEMAAEKLTPVTLELGGKSPCVVEADANIEVAAKRIALTKFSNAGQMCVAPDYVLVHHSRRDALIEAFRKVIPRFYGEDPSGSHNYGKIVNASHFRRLVSYINQGQVVIGGKHDEARDYIEPTVLTGVSMEMTVMGEEIFGPVLPLLTFGHFEEAKAIIQHHPEPLAFYVFTSSAEKEKRWIEGLPFGGGCVNNASWHLTNFNLPFGGRGQSGIGAYHGRYSFEVFSHRKAIMKTPTWFDPRVKYPPFKGKLPLFKRIIR